MNHIKQEKIPLPSAELQVEGLSDADRFDVWRQAVMPLMQVEPVSKTAISDTKPQLKQHMLENVMFMETWHPDADFSRDNKHLAQFDDVDHIIVQAFVEGGYIKTVNGESEYLEQCGNTCVLNLGYTLEGQGTASRVLHFIMPRDWVRQELPFLGDFKGILFDSGSMATQIFSNYLLEMPKYLDNACMTDSPTIEGSLVGLLESLYRHQDIASETAAGASMAVITRYIDQNLHNPSLNVDVICQRFKCSRSTVYRLMQPVGGVREHIRRRRLGRAYKLLMDPGLKNRRIFDIARMVGFQGPDIFSRAFRQEFGISASDLREAGLSGLDVGKWPLWHQDDQMDPHGMLKMRNWFKRVGGVHE